jgi:hypothetical protein
MTLQPIALKLDKTIRNGIGAERMRRHAALRHYGTHQLLNILDWVLRKNSLRNPGVFAGTTPWSVARDE